MDFQLVIYLNDSDMKLAGKILNRVVSARRAPNERGLVVHFVMPWFMTDESVEHHDSLHSFQDVLLIHSWLD